MARYTGPKSRIDRRFGETILGSEKVRSRRNFPPGQHGNNRRRKTSEYGVMLAEKQKAKYTYGVHDERFVISTGLKKAGLIPRFFNPTELLYVHFAPQGKAHKKGQKG